MLYYISVSLSSSIIFSKFAQLFYGVDLKLTLKIYDIHSTSYINALCHLYRTFYSVK